MPFGTDGRSTDLLAEAIRPYHKEGRPVVLKGAVLTAPATTLWTSWDYWDEAFGDEDDGDDHDPPPMVSVEIGGGGYGTPEGCERAEIPIVGYLQYLRLFEERHGRHGSDSDLRRAPAGSGASAIPPDEVVYMAQNDLPSRLHRDVVIPEFCRGGGSDEGDDEAGSDGGVGLGRLYSVMLWLGPRGCISPLHYDPLDNCLMQHVGRKRVILYERSSASSSTTAAGWHYGGHDGRQSNTSPIVPPDDSGGSLTSDLTTLLARYPLYAEAPTPLECVLHPGDLLYIPAGWWHYVLSVDTSASVNVWWR